jgi:two-component system response regulator YesN
VRIDRAKELLRETSLSVSEVCEAVGYSDRKHFTKTFHKMTGVNPAEFRRLYG